MNKLSLIITLFISLSIHSQKEANFWYFGNNAALDFNSGAPVPVVNSQLNTTEGCSSFSNSKGELLFYVGAPSPNSRNLTIWNKNNTPMPLSSIVTFGTKTLKGDSSSSQSALTIPHPKNNNLYYLFTVGAVVGSDGEYGFWYYTIDMSKDGGLGDVIEGPVELHSSSLKSQWSEKITAVRADTCNTFWVISFTRNNTFFAYKINEKGVDIKNPIISTISGLSINDPRGYLKVSPDGSKLVLANMTNGAFLFNFDDVTGKVTNYDNQPSPQLLNTGGESPYGVEFSTSSRRLYVSTGQFNPSNENLFQFDVTKSTISEVNNSRYTVHNYFNTRGALQLGPDAKIYWTSDQNDKISVINNPEELGNACNYSHQSVDLGEGKASQGLPPFLSSLLLPIKISDFTTGKVINNQTKQSCVGNSLTIVPENITSKPGSTVNYEWFFNGSSSPFLKSKNLNITTLKKSNSGDYKLKISLTNDCGDKTILEGLFKLEIYESTFASKPTDILFCDIDNDGFNTFSLGKDVTPQVLNGKDPAVFEVKYFLSQTDADTNTNDLPLVYKNPTPYSSQNIYARMHNKDAPNACYDIKKFSLIITGKPILATPINYEECDDNIKGTDTDGFFNSFLLNTKDKEILGSLDPTIYEVSYHTTLIGAQTDKNKDVIIKDILYRNNTIYSETIYVRVENKKNSNCNNSSKSFNLIVNKLPIIINKTIVLKQCDTDADLNTTINLTLGQKNISDNHTNETFKYYPTENNAINDSSEITNQITHPVINGNSIWVRTISSKNCFRISKIDIIVSYSSDITYSKQFENCDDFLDKQGNDTLNNNDTDGITYFDLSSVETDVKTAFPLINRNDLDVLIFETIADRDAVINKISDIKNYRNSNIPAKTKQTLYIKIINKINNDCTGLGRFFIKVNSIPNFNVKVPQIVCLNSRPMVLKVETDSKTYNYEWKKGNNPKVLSNTKELNISTGGHYTITVTDTSTLSNCKRTKTIIINESIIASLEENDISITDDSNNNSITISRNNLGIGDYEFALKNSKGFFIKDFQDEPFFDQLKGGVYNVLVRDKNNCGIATLEVSVVEFPKFFTPNNDGYNDVWNVKGGSSDFYLKSNIFIFDRHGKILSKFKINGQGWNGTYKGKLVPSNDYWFTIELTNKKGITRSKKGHFSLLRK